jgi:hypothetical protein
MWTRSSIGRLELPGLLDKAVDRLTSAGKPASSAWPIAVASLQKAGDLKKGSVKATAKGAARNQMSRAQRQAKPP